MVLVVRTSPVWCVAVSTRSGGTRLGGSGFGGVFGAVTAGVAGLRCGALGGAGLGGAGLLCASNGAEVSSADVNKSRQGRSTGPPTQEHRAGRKSSSARATRGYRTAEFRPVSY